MRTLARALSLSAVTVALALALLLLVYRTAPGRALTQSLPPSWVQALQQATQAQDAEAWADVEFVAIGSVCLLLAAVMVALVVLVMRGRNSQRGGGRL